MFGKIFGLFIVLLVAPATYGQCRQCMPNLAYCINETSYQLCDTSTNPAAPIGGTYNCGENEFCTDSPNICELEPNDDTIVSVCGSTASTSSCSSCRANGDRICLSSTQFALCRSSGNALTASNPLSCPTGELCSEDLFTQLKSVCAPQCVIDYMKAELTCPSTEVVTPSTETPTDAPDVDVTDYCTGSSKTGSYFQVPITGNCRAYAYCQRQSTGGFLALEMKCKTGQFYSEAQNRCIAASRCPQ